MAILSLISYQIEESLKSSKRLLITFPIFAKLSFAYFLREISLNPDKTTPSALLRKFSVLLEAVFKRYLVNAV